MDPDLLDTMRRGAASLALGLFVWIHSLVDLAQNVTDICYPLYPQLRIHFMIIYYFMNLGKGNSKIWTKIWKNITILPRRNTGGTKKRNKQIDTKYSSQIES
jgi:hypothetical protein